MNALALDIGTATGVAIYENGDITIGTRKLRHDKRASGLRFLDFHNWLIKTIETHNICIVYFERIYGHKGTDAAHVYGGFMYMLAAVCEEMKVRCVGIPVGAIKKFATGRENATKEEMIAFARSKGFDPVDDNAADALAILLTGLNPLSLRNILNN
jgi:Holliday junction resolvasome RuvABC endonuclease subunit